MRKLLWGALGALALLGAALGVLVWQFDGEKLRPLLERSLGESLGREVSIERLSLEALRGRVLASGLRIADVAEAGADPFLEAESVRVAVSLWPLLSRGRLQVDALHLMRPRLRLVELEPGRWNASSLGAGSRSSGDSPAAEGEAEASALVLSRLLLDEGSLLLQRHGLPPREYASLRIEAEGLGAARRFPLRVGAALPAGGRLTLDGEVGPLAADPLRSPLAARLVLRDMDLAASGLTGANSALRGLLDVDLELAAADAVLQAQGQLGVRGLRLLGSGEASALPLKLELESRYELASRQGELQRASLAAGGARLTLEGRFSHPAESLQLALQLKGEKMPVDDLQALLPAFGIALPAESRLAGGEMDLSLRLSGALDALHVEGPVLLRESRLEGYSLGAQLAALSALAGLPAPADTRIQRASLTLRQDPRRLRLLDIDAEIAELGSLSGGGEIDAGGAVDMALTLRLDAELAEAAGARLGRVAGGALRHAARSGLGLTVSGGIDAPRFAIERRSLAGSLVSGLLSGAEDDDEEDASRSGRASGRDAASALFELLRQRGDEKKDERNDADGGR